MQQECPIAVHFHNEVIGEYYADLIVENLIIVELKAVSEILPIHEVQLVNYLRATEIEVVLILNFGIKPQHKRKIFTNDLKPNLNL